MEVPENAWSAVPTHSMGSWRGACFSVRHLAKTFLTK